MGFSTRVKRSTLADANEGRDLHIYVDLATLLIRRTRKLYCNDSFGIELDSAVYALDDTTIDLRLSLFPWAPFRSMKALIKLHTLLASANLFTFIHIADGKMGDVNVMDMLIIEAGAFYVMDRGYLDSGRLYALHQVGAFFVTRAKGRMNSRSVYSMQNEPDAFIICEQRIALDGFTAKLCSIPQPMRQSLTYDQGKEMARHAELTFNTGVKVYFYDPHSPWAAGQLREHQRTESTIPAQGHGSVDLQPGITR